MSALADFYPPAPIGVPEDFTKPGKTYKWRVVFLLMGLIGCLFLYLGLISITGWAIYYLYHHPPNEIFDPNFFRKENHLKYEIWAYVIWVTCLFVLSSLFIFYFKGLFKGNITDWSSLVELRPKDQPRLFAFIEKLCEETQAPKPHKVFLGHHVSAEVISKTTLLNIIIPPKKHLLIGAGMLEVINLSEFKAALGHEFGHFSQKNSWAIGNYVFLFNKILRDMIYSRDIFDEFLIRWSTKNLRFSFPAWALRGMVWSLRKPLESAYKGLHLLDHALSRQMEFKADDVAVSVAGTDAIVGMLFKTGIANKCHQTALALVLNAAENGFYSMDILYHQSRVATYLRKIRDDATLEIPTNPIKKGHTGKVGRVFDPAKGNTGIPKMWLSHPPNHEREQNAKRVYLQALEDDRSPWILFDNTDRLKMDLSLKFYGLSKEKMPVAELVDPERVQQFIDRELAEQNHNPKYENIYATRWLNLANLDFWETQAETEPMPIETIPQFLQEYPTKAFKDLVSLYYVLARESDLLQGIIDKKIPFNRRTLPFRGAARKSGEFKSLLEQVQKEFNLTIEVLSYSDREVYLNHYLAAKELDQARATELQLHYRFHQRVQDWLRLCIQLKGCFDENNKTMREYSNLSPFFYQDLKRILNESRTLLLDMHKGASFVDCPNWSNIQPGSTLQNLVFDEVLDLGEAVLPHEGIPSPWIDLLHCTVEKTKKRLEKVYRKSLGSILLFQEDIAREYLAKTAGESAQNPESTAPVPEGTSRA